MRIHNELKERKLKTVNRLQRRTLRKIKKNGVWTEDLEEEGILFFFNRLACIIIIITPHLTTTPYNHGTCPVTSNLSSKTKNKLIACQPFTPLAPFPLCTSPLPLFLPTWIYCFLCFFTFHSTITPQHSLSL